MNETEQRVHWLDKALDVVRNAVPESAAGVEPGVDMPAVVVPREQIVEVCTALRDDPGLRFTMLSDLTASDYLDRDPRFDVVYHLLSFDLNARLRVKVGVPESDCRCPSVTSVWPGANWPEREVWDMFGIRFTGHPNLERILTPEGWEYFALRRDFPLQGPGMVRLYEDVTDVL